MEIDSIDSVGASSRVAVTYGSVPSASSEEDRDLVVSLPSMPGAFTVGGGKGGGSYRFDVLKLLTQLDAPNIGKYQATKLIAALNKVMKNLQPEDPNFDLSFSQLTAGIQKMRVITSAFAAIDAAEIQAWKGPTNIMRDLKQIA